MANEVTSTAFGSAGQSGATAGAGSVAAVTGSAASGVLGGGTAAGGGPCPPGQALWYQSNAESGLPTVAQPGWVDPVTGQPLLVGSRLVDQYCGSTFIQTTVVLAPGPPGAAAAAVDPAVLAQQALSNAPFPPLVTVISPPPGREIVNFTLFLSLQGAGPVTASASAGTVTSTVSIVPGTVTWDMGDGATLTCQGPGVAFDPSRPVAAQSPPACGYAYPRSSANAPGAVFQVTAHVHYTVSWTVTGAPGGGVLAPVVRTTTVAVSVGEVQTLNR